MVKSDAFRSISGLKLISFSGTAALGQRIALTASGPWNPLLAEADNGRPGLQRRSVRDLNN